MTGIDPITNGGVMKSKKTLLATVGGLALLSGSAQAALIGAFDFDTASGWLADGTAVTYDSGANANLNCAAGALPGANGCGLTFSGLQEITDGHTTVNWFSNGGQGPSGLDIQSNSGTLVTNGGWFDTGVITHRNFSLPSPATTLRNLNLGSEFSITSPFAFGPAVGAFNIGFTETPNQGGCPAPNPLGSACDDFFSISGIPLPIVVEIDGIVYTFTFRLQGGEGFIVDDNTLYTREGGQNTLFVQAMVTAREVQVPEPATLGILGLGLLLLNRRKFIK